MKFFCFPHAGGLAFSYNALKKSKETKFDVMVYEYKGRGDRILEEKATTYQDLINDAIGYIERNMNDDMYILFGHSFGAWVVHSLNEEILNRNFKPPITIFLSGALPYDTTHPSLWKCIHENNFKVIEEFLTQLGGIDKSIQCSHMFFRYYLSLFREDLLLMRNRLEQAKNDTLLISCKLNIIWGDNDLIFSSNSIRKWEKYSANPVFYKKISGNHFSLLEKDFVNCDELINTFFTEVIR